MNNYLLNRIQKKIQADDGVTLVEMMVALAIASLLVIVLGNVYTNQQKIGTAQNFVSEVQQNIRAAIYTMGREIRMAGYDYRKTANAGFTAATANILTFTAVADTDSVDNNNDGTVDEPDELQTISYYLYDAYGDGDTDMGRKDGVAAVQAIAENIDAIEFYYTLQDKTQTLAPAQLSDIRAVTISILASTGRADSDYVDNNVYTPAGGTLWDLGNGPGVAAADNFHRRLLTTTIQCRNLEL